MGGFLKKRNNHHYSKREPQASKSFFRKKHHVTKCIVEISPTNVVTKIRYNSMKDASKTLSRIRFLRKKHNADRIEKRVYKCNACQGWHVTSQE